MGTSIFGVPTLIAVHKENDPNGDGLEIAKAYAAATGGDRAGVLESSFVAEVKSDLMGEQTILCGMLQTGSLLCFERMVAEGIEPGYASKLVQYGWETITEALKQGGITLMEGATENGTMGGAHVLLMLGKDKAGKTLAELNPDAVVASPGVEGEGGTAPDPTGEATVEATAEG